MQSIHSYLKELLSYLANLSDSRRKFLAEIVPCFFGNSLYLRYSYYCSFVLNLLDASGIRIIEFTVSISLRAQSTNICGVE